MINHVITLNEITQEVEVVEVVRGSVAIVSADIGTIGVESVNGLAGIVVLNQDLILDGTTYKQYSQTEKTKLSGIETGAEVNNISDVNAGLLTGGGEITLHSHAGGVADEKVKYDVNDTAAGYLGAKTAAGTGITLSEGTGADADKLLITNSAPDQTVALTAGTNMTSITGTYPNFTLNAATQTTDISGKLSLDQTTPQTLTGLTDGSLSIKGSKLVTNQYTHTYFVSKLGADTNSGTSEGTAFLTISKALESSVSGDLVHVLDGEIYAETLIIPTNVTVEMRSAGLSGQVILATNSKIFLLKHYSSANDEIMVRCIGTSGSIYTCLAGQSSASHTGIIHFKPSAIGGFIVANIAKITVGNGNTLVYSNAGSSGINIATTPANFSSDKALNYGTPADLVYGDSGYCQWSIAAVSFPVAITYNIGTGTTVTMYKIVGTTSTTRSPKNWILEGKLGAGAWETIDTRTDITWTSSEQKEFTIATPGSYDQYRITISSSSNADWLQIADIGFWAGVASVAGDIMITAGILSLGEESFGILSHDEFQRVVTNINNIYQEEDTEDATFIEISDGIVSHRGNVASTDILWNKTGGILVWDTAFKAGTETGVATAYTLTQDNLLIAATASNDGYATSVQITKLDGIEAGADVTDATNVGSSVHGATEKTSLVDADEFALIDSEATNVLKRTLWSTIKSTIKTYADTLYSVTTHNHDLTYLGINSKAADSDKLDGSDSTAFATSGHTHTGTYEPVLTGAANKVTIHDSDRAIMLNSESANATNYWLWSAVKTNIASYYDGLISSVTALKTFTKDKFAMVGTSTGKNIISVANTSATDYTNTLPAKTGTIAMTSDIVAVDHSSDGDLSELVGVCYGTDATPPTASTTTIGTIYLQYTA